MKKQFLLESFGELLGTFILVFFGCGSVGVAVLFNSFSLFEVAMIWGLGVAIAIFSVRNICLAHLNPAISVALCIDRKVSFQRTCFYLLGQFMGAAIAAIAILLLFGSSISIYEQQQGILKHEIGGEKTAMIFGEFFPNPGFKNTIAISWLMAMVLESFGTFVLLFVILKLTERKDKVDNLTPLMIGLTVTIIICIVAPFTQAGLNPARDFAPRIVAYCAGWKMSAFPNRSFIQSFIYIIGPVIGAFLAVLLNRVTSAPIKKEIM